MNKRAFLKGLGLVAAPMAVVAIPVLAAAIPEAPKPIPEKYAPIAFWGGPENGVSKDWLTVEVNGEGENRKFRHLKLY